MTGAVSAGAPPPPPPPPQEVMLNAESAAMIRKQLVRGRDERRAAKATSKGKDGYRFPGDLSPVE